MTDLGDVIAFIVASQPGVTDRALTEAIFGPEQPVGLVLRACGDLELAGRIKRRRTLSGRFAMANFPGPDLKVNRDPKSQRILSVA